MVQTILGSFEGEWYTVHDAQQARLLTHPEACRLLAPFIGRERSVSEAAREAGCSVERLLYRVRQFTRVGLLRETRAERRAGRAIRHYRAVADGFHVPFELTPFQDTEALIARQAAPHDQLRNRALARHMWQASHQGRRIYRDLRSGELHHEAALTPQETLPALRQQSSVIDFSSVLRLPPDVARAFARELDDLYARLAAARLPDGQGQAFLMQAQLVPLAPEDLE